MNFTWDPHKEKDNIRNHHLSFSTAKFVFNDPERWERFDREHSTDEDRWQILGLVNDVLFLVYTERGEECRLITARPADEDERRIYYGSNKRDANGWTKAN